MMYEVRLTNVPDGAYTEDYLGCDRMHATRKEARATVAAFRLAQSMRPDDMMGSDIEGNPAVMTAVIIERDAATPPKPCGCPANLGIGKHLMDCAKVRR